MSDQLRTVISQGGRIVIPADLRKQFGWEEGQEVILQPDLHGLYVSTPSDAWKRLQDIVTSHKSGKKINLVDRLIAERRQEASRE